MTESGPVFTSFFMHSADAPWTVDDAFRSYAALADIHDVETDDAVNEALDSAANFTLVGGWAVADNALYITATGTGDIGQNYTAVHDTDSPRNGKITFDCNYISSGGLMFRATDADNYYCFYKSGDNISFAKVVSGSLSYLNKLTLPSGFVNGCSTFEIEVAWREMRYSTVDNDYWLCMTVSIDGWNALDAYDQIVEAAVPPQKWGFMTLAVGVGAGISVENIRMPLLGDIVDFATLDTGETPMSGAQRFLQGRNIRIANRWDGSVRVWQPREFADGESSAHDFDDSNSDDFAPTTDLNALLTHVRFVGAAPDDIADAYDFALAAKYGHRFSVVNNPYVTGDKESYREAQRQLEMSEENAFGAAITIPATFHLEKEDVVGAPDGNDYIIDQISISGDKASALMRLSLRKFVYGS